MYPARREAVITGLGAVSAIASDCRTLWDAIASGQDGIEAIRRFSVEGFRVRTGAVVKAWADTTAAEGLGTQALCRRFAEDAATEAILDASLNQSDLPRDRIGFVFGTGLVGGAGEPIDALVGRLADDLDLHGPRIVVSTACSSSTGALGLARDLLAMNAADVVVAGGADVLSAEVFAGFHALGVLSPGKCAPFSRPLGTTLGEGAGFLILERSETAARRNARSRAVLSGYGLSGDAFHETSPDPTGSGVERALRGALQDAALSEEAIGYVNVHGSGTEANDPAEWRGIRRGLGAHAQHVPVSSTKGALGHAQGAAGVLEVIVTILAMEHGVAPPTQHFEGPRPHAPVDPVAGKRPRPCSYEHALCLNSAFGGANAAIVLSRRSRPPRSITRRPIGIFGVGLVGPWGFGVEAFEQWCSEAPRGSRVPPLPIQQFVPRADPRGLDPMSRFLAIASTLAMKDAGNTSHGEARNPIGLLVGAARPSSESVKAFHRSIEERGLQALSAPAFARIVLNAPGGFCSKLLSLRGPHSTVSAGAASGMIAIALAAEYLSARKDVDWIIAGGAEETSDEDTAELEGACCLMLGERGGEVAQHTPVVRIVGWGIAGPHRISEAIRRAREGISRPNAALNPRTASERLFPIGNGREYGSGAAASAAACAQAVLAVRRGDVDNALVVTDSDHGSSVAILLTR